MSYQPTKLPQNVPGRFYVTDACLACMACQELAPKNFRFGEYGMSYVFKQPATSEELQQCVDALEHCPLAAIKDESESDRMVVP